MISANFYPTTYDLTNPVRQLTDNIEYNPDGTATDIELSDAYWLGWMKWETVPDCWKFSTYTQTADTITIDFVTPSQNVNVGYVARRYTSAQTGRRWSNMYRRSDDSVTMYSSGYPNQYLNKYDIMGCASIRQFWVQIFAACEYKTGSSATTYINAGIQLGSRYVDEYLSFFNGESTLDFSLNVGSVGSVNISLDIANIEDDNTFIIEGTQGGYDYKIKAYFAFVCTNTAPDVTASGDYVTGVTATNIIPMIGVTIDDDYYLLCGDTSHFTQVLGQIQIQVLANYVFNPNQMFNNMLVGGYKAEIDKNVFNSMAVNNTYFSGNTAFVKTASGNSGVLNRVLSPQEIMTIIGIMPRVGRGYDSTNVANYGYTENVIWATYVTDENEFTATLITGDLTDDEFRAKLRPWQYDVNEWSENEYTPDDLPPYTPEGDDGTDSGGDDIRPSDWTNLRIGAANNFVTLYGMTAASVADFGRQLWADLADPAFWQMVGTAFTNDFSINPADMMRYFISLRYYPFDVSDLFPNSTVSGIYVGRAATPIAPSTGVAYPIRVPNNVVQVDGGRLTIRRYYNDFRDYEPCTTVQIHVPFCGSVDVPASEVMGHEMDLTYKIDLQTGAMLAVLGVASNTYYVIATLAGTCGASIPITANNNIEFLQRIATVGSGLIGGGVSGAVKGATVGGEVGAVVGAVAGTVGGGVGALAGLPPVTVHKQGNASGFANLGGVPYAYATVQRGRFERPANYGHTTGFACDFSATLGSLSGFTVCDNVDTSGLTCNADERDEIKRLLESGVYV